MPNLLDSVLVVDVEATCWSGPTPEGQTSEIIEIGVCRLDVSGVRAERASILVRPAVSTVSEFCTELTTLTQADVDTGVSFADACRELEERFASRSRVWASFGEYDRNIFQRQCERTSTPYPFNTRHINVKTLTALMLRLPHEVGMTKAADLLGINVEGTHHRGGDDAWNIAAILSRLIFDRTPGGIAVPNVEIS